MKMHSIERRRRAGFTLAEMMVVIVILGLLATLVVPNVMQKLGQAFGGKAKADITAIMTSLDDFAMQNQMRYPESLEKLLEPDVNGHKYLDLKNLPKDPWGNEYGYEPASGGGKPRVFCLGKDGQPGGEGDNADFDNETILNGDPK